MINENLELIRVIKGTNNDKVLCRCKLCGRTFTMWRSHYYRGSTACKCVVHHKRLYPIYMNMKSRCYNPNTPGYKNYGGRGVKICDEWLHDYTVFEKWSLENGYNDDLTIERKDVNGDYTPSNCIWITNNRQQQNKRTTLRIEGTSLKDWCTKNGVNYKTLYSYLTRHSELSVEEVANRYRRRVN